MGSQAFDVDYSGIGCAKKAVCRGSATWQIYKTGEYIQYFCTAEQKSQAQRLGTPYDTWTLLEDKKHNEWEHVCSYDDDCGNDESCRSYFHQADASNKSWTRGRVCAPYWQDRNCLWYGDTYMSNVNYNTTGYDYQMTYICENEAEVERIRLEQEAEAERIRLEEERKAAEEAERIRREQEAEAERQRIEEERKAAEAREAERIRLE